jgi:hypothetical protein
MQFVIENGCRGMKIRVTFPAGSGFIAGFLKVMTGLAATISCELDYMFILMFLMGKSYCVSIIISINQQVLPAPWWTYRCLRYDLSH